MVDRIPPDLARAVFQLLFPAEPLPLHVAGPHWFAVLLVSRAWRQALLEAAPTLTVAVSAAPPLPAGSLPWLQAQASTLHLRGSSDPMHASMQSIQALYDRIAWFERLGAGLAAPGPPDAAPMLDLAACQQLQELSITCQKALSADEYQPAFNTAPLAQLPRLRALTLERFSGFHLQGLPASLRTLRCVSADVCFADADLWPSVEALALPEACRLDSARIIYGGADEVCLGDVELELEEALQYAGLVCLPLCRMSHACRRLESDVHFVCLGEPAKGVPLVVTDDVGPLLDALLSAMSGDALLRRLELDPDSRCILSGGQLVQTAALASPAGRAQLAQHAAAGLLSVQESASADLLQPQDALERAVRQPRLAARRVVVTSAAGESGPA